MIGDGKSKCRFSWSSARLKKHSDDGVAVESCVGANFSLGT
jgi:hypothetical protein